MKTRHLAMPGYLSFFLELEAHPIFLEKSTSEGMPPNPSEKSNSSASFSLPERLVWVLIFFLAIITKRTYHNSSFINLSPGGTVTNSINL